MTCLGLSWNNFSGFFMSGRGRVWRGFEGEGKGGKRRKGPSKYCISVSVCLAGLDWTFDVIYRVDQREEINTNISAVWPSVWLPECLFTHLSLSLLFLFSHLPVWWPQCMYVYLLACVMVSFSFLFDCLQAVNLHICMIRCQDTYF